MTEESCQHRQSTDYLLVPDASSGRRVRQVLATNKLGFRVKVGTWRELLEEIRLSHLIGPIDDDWADLVVKAASTSSDGFWADSFSVDPNGTSAVIATLLKDLVIAGGHTGQWETPGLPTRVNLCLSDLRNLWSLIGEPLPAELVLMKSIEGIGSSATHTLNIHHLPDWPRLVSAQVGLISVVNGASAVLSEELSSILGEIAHSHLEPKPTNTVGQLARDLYSGGSGVVEMDDTLEFILERDSRQEAERVTGAIQKIVDLGAEPSDCGVMLPSDGSYNSVLFECLSYAGIRTAGLPLMIERRDLGGDVVRSLILLTRGFAPKMSIADLLSSPLAPWRREIGIELAKAVNSNRFDLRRTADMTDEEERDLSVLRRLRAKPDLLGDAIEIFARETIFAEHQVRLHSLSRVLSAAISEATNINYEALLQMVGHAQIREALPVSFAANGVRIFVEDQEPWADVTHLFVLGYNAGRYPALQKTSHVFHDLERQEINRHLGWDLAIADEKMAAARSRAQRQLAASKKNLTFLASARNLKGSAVPLAETVTFMSALLGSEVDHLFHSTSLGHVSAVQSKVSEGHESDATQSVALHFDRDLLRLRLDTDGNPRSESPSSLENLLVSPLAWLLGKLGALPDLWEPDKLSPLLQGNLSHSVFEDLFYEDAPRIDPSQVHDLVDSALDKAISKQAPLLSSPQWKVEKYSLRSTLVDAVKRWASTLEAIDAKVVGAEQRLKGQFSNIAVRGFADQIIRLPDGTFIVIDFKKSSSGSRKRRMELGYECQVSLYETMLSQMSAAGQWEPTSNTGVEIAYYTLNDQVLLVNETNPIPDKLPGLVRVDGDVSEHALAELKERIAELQEGTIKLNSNNDPEQLSKKKGLPKFALESSPIIMMFAHDEIQEEAT